jgi:hypothetical protein
MTNLICREDEERDTLVIGSLVERQKKELQGEKKNCKL